MDFWRTVLVLFRRWYLTVPAFLAALDIAAAVFISIPTHYVSVSVLVLTTPTDGGSLQTDGQGQIANKNLVRTNPLLNFDKGLSTTAAILIQMLSSPETAAKVGAPAGGGTTIKVTNGSSNPELGDTSPFVFIEVDSISADTAKGIVTRLTQEASAELTARQRALGAPPSTFITVGKVVPPTLPQPLRKSKARAAAAALALGCVAALTAAYGAESFSTSRRARKRGTGAGKRGTGKKGLKARRGGTKASADAAVAPKVTEPAQPAGSAGPVGPVHPAEPSGAAAHPDDARTPSGPAAEQATGEEPVGGRAGRRAGIR